MNAADFRARHLTVGALNGIPFNDILTLKTDQSIDILKIEGKVFIKEPLKVNRFHTNGVNKKNPIIDLRMERSNTVMVKKKKLI